MDCYFKTGCRLSVSRGWCSLCSCGIRLASMTVEQHSLMSNDAEQYHPIPKVTPFTNTHSSPVSTVILSTFQTSVIRTNSQDGHREKNHEKCKQPDSNGMKSMLGKDATFQPSREEIIAQRKLLRAVRSTSSIPPPTEPTKQNDSDQ